MILNRQIYADADYDEVRLVIPVTRPDMTSVSDLVESVNNLSSGDEITVKVAKYRKKKSLDANAYCWVLIKELAKKLQIAYPECYKQLIREGGEYELFPLKDEAVETWIANWQSRGIGWVSEIVGKSKFDGYTNVRSYYGISVYDTKQMARFIDVVIDACKEHGVPTASTTEIERYKSEWK